MASMTMTASFAIKPLPTPAPRRGVLAVRASGDSKNMVAGETKEENNGRRDMMLGVAVAAAAAAFSITAKVAMAEEPKRGSEAAKKKYAPICVTMPTARICRN